MRTRFVVAISVTALAVVACSSVVNGKGSAGSGGPVAPSSPSTAVSTPVPSVTGFPSISPSVPVSSSSSSIAPPPPVSSSPFPTVTSAPPVGQADFKCPSIEYPYAHLSFVCVADKMQKSTKDKVWPLVERQVVSHYAQGREWTLDTGAGHWGTPGSDSLRDITVKVRTAMVDNGSYGDPAPAIRTTGKQIKISGHNAYQLMTTFTINPSFRRSSGAPIKHEKSWILAIEIAPDDVSLWYVSVPDAVSYYWPLIDSLISTINVD